MEHSTSFSSTEAQRPRARSTKLRRPQTNIEERLHRQLHLLQRERDTQRALADIKICWYGPLWRPMGYAVHNRELATRLMTRIPGLVLIPTQGLPGPPSPLQLQMLKRSAHPSTADDADLVIQCTPTTPYRLGARYSVLLTTIESRRPHHGLVNRLKLHDELWFPCTYNARSIPRDVRRGRPIRVMPEGVDTTVFYPLRPAPPPLKSHRKLYTFHSDWSGRKGHRLLLQSWCRFQPDHPDAALLLLSKPGMNTDYPAVLQMTKELNSMLPAGRRPSDYNIELLTAAVSNRMLNRIYNQTYCGVLPSLGEAWSLFPCQLSAVGRPTITTAFGGHLDYLNHGNAYLITVDHFGAIDQGHKSAVCFYNDVDFAIPDGDHLTALLHFTYHHERDVERRGARAFHRVTTRFTWNMAADKVFRRILELCDLLSTS